MFDSPLLFFSCHSLFNCMSPSRGVGAVHGGHGCAASLTKLIFSFCLTLLCQIYFFNRLSCCTAEQQMAQCFEQQYANRVVKFGALHVVRRVGIIAPLGAFYLAHFIDQEDTVKELRRFPSLLQRHLARQANGELLVIYSGHSAHSVEWARVDLLASALRLEPILDADDVQPQHVSPVLLVTACSVLGLSAPVSLPSPYSLKTRSTAGFDEQQQQQRLISNNITPAYENELRINFKTFQNALFVYSVADYGDHLVVQLAAGRVEVFFDFGGNQRSQLTGGLALNDGEWHELIWSHHFDTAELFVDGVRVNRTEIGGLYRKLDLHSTVEIGGRPEEIGDEQIIDFSLENAFYGCLARMELNGLNLLASAPKLLPSCQMPRPQLVALGPRSSLQIPYSFLPFSFDFHVLLQRPLPVVDHDHVEAEHGQQQQQRQRQDDVPLLSILDMANATLLQLSIAELDGGAMSVRTSLGRGAQAPRVVALAGGVARGWHAVVVKLRGGDALEVELDGRVAYWVEGAAARRIGTTMHTFLLSATGCYRSATIDLKQGIPICGEMIRDHCPLVESCSPNPCQNGGQCVQNGFASFNCECQQNYTGHFCHISKLPHSCEEHFASGTASRRLLVDLDGGGPLRPFVVECRRGGHGAKRRKSQAKFDGPNIEEVQTVVRHDAPPQGIIVRGITEPGAVRRVLHYGLSETELDRLVSAFDQCGQLMRFQCKGGQRLMHYGAENRPSAWYASRNAQHGLQWGDAPPFSRMCSCALNDSCAGQRGCNCDSGQDAVDVGLNTHQQLLPILQLFIGGGTEANAMANVSIGPLECSGRFVFETITFMDRNQRLISSHTFPSASTFHAALSIRLARPQLTIFTYASANHERWFQLFVRAGHLVGQLIYAGISHELVSDMAINDNRWHAISWEVDEMSIRLVVDRIEKTVFAASVTPRASLLIIGARTGKDRSGFAGQMRDFRLNGAELALGQMAQRALGAGVQLGAWGACDAQNACRNGGHCVELYDAFTCNCSLTPFSGELCEDEIGMWVPLGSELKIAWQHPAQVSNCFRVSVQSASTDVTLIRARALFAESNFDMSIDRRGHLNLHVFDGVFFSQNATLSSRFLISDNKSKDIQFCANSTGLELSINGEQALVWEGNFTFFFALNSWQFVDPNFAGCIARLMIGDAFPLKDPRGSRLQYSGKIRFGSCPYDNLEHHRKTTSAAHENGADHPEIYATASNVMKSQRQLLFITPAIGFASALCILLSLCVFLLYIQRRPDGVYKTHECNAFVPAGGGTVGDDDYGTGTKEYGNGAATAQFGRTPTSVGSVRFAGISTLMHTRLLDVVDHQQQQEEEQRTINEQSMQREYFC